MTRYALGWLEDAACAAHPDLPWIPEGRPDPDAVDLCVYACPVRQACARAAVAHIDRAERSWRLVGIHGGIVLPLKPGAGRAAAIAELRLVAAGQLAEQRDEGAA